MLSAHNILATSQANQNPTHIFRLWSQTPVVSNANTPQLRAGNFFGASYNAAAVTETHKSWFYDLIFTLINPAILRTLSQRIAFDPVATYPFNAATVSDLTPNSDGSLPAAGTFTAINPYVYALCADRRNIRNIRQFVATMSTLLSDAKLNAGSLSSSIEEEAGISILSHCYAGPTLPTWSARFDQTAFTGTMPTAGLTLTHADAFATTTEFLIARPFTASTRNANTVWPTTPTPGTALAFMASPLLMVVNALSTAAGMINPDSYIEFDERYHVAPNMRILLPFDANPSEGYIPQITGRIIETAEIDGFSISHPDARIPLSQDNSFVLQSAVRIQHIQRASNSTTILHTRVLRHADSQPVTINMYDMAVNRIGRIVTDAETTVGYAPTDQPFGFTQTTNVHWTDLVSNKISYLINRRPDRSTVAPIEQGYIHGWSPYRYVVDPLQATPAESIYMILDLRPIFGTSTPLMESEHASIRIPRK